jgi:putative membrane protein
MPRLKNFIKQFNWKIILIRILVNAITLVIVALIIPDIYFATRTLGAVLIVAIALGVINAIFKPLVLLVTGQFIFVTYGLLVIVLNALILYILEALFPTYFVVNNVWWALLGATILSLVSNALENLLGLNMPIVPDEEVELRKRLEASKRGTLASLVAQPAAVVGHDSETQSVSDVASAKAALEAIGAAEPEASPTVPEQAPEQPEAQPNPPVNVDEDDHDELEEGEL